ncbi:unnamed protein product [Phaeothamnion confervicola]
MGNKSSSSRSRPSTPPQQEQQAGGPARRASPAAAAGATGPGAAGAAAAAASNNAGLLRTTCPRCHTELLTPPAAPQFRCPCGVIFSRAGAAVGVAGPGQMPLPPGGSVQLVVCSGCGRVGMLPQRQSVANLVCECGTAVRPATAEQLMAMLARGSIPSIPAVSPPPRGVSPELLALLPVIPFRPPPPAEAALRDDDDDTVSCRVCLEPFMEAEELRLLPCLHRYHLACADAWFGRSTNCPLCNTNLVEMFRESAAAERR